MARDLPERFRSSPPMPATQTASAARSDQPARERPDEGDGERLAGQPAPTRLLRFPAVRERTGLSRSTIWRLEQQGLFPRRRRISRRRVAWAAEEVLTWTQSKIAGIDAAGDRQ